MLCLNDNLRATEPNFVPQVLTERIIFGLSEVGSVLFPENTVPNDRWNTDSHFRAKKRILSKFQSCCQGGCYYKYSAMVPVHDVGSKLLTTTTLSLPSHSQNPLHS